MSSELIVDFPKLKLKCKSESGTIVRFAPFRECHFYEPQHKSDHSKLFYKKHDYRDMRIANHEAVMDVQKKFLPLLLASKSKSSSHGVDFDPDVIFGNEKLLTPNLIKKTSVARKNCVSAVLQEQARQHESGRADPDAIAHASQQYSKAAVRRARTIGLLQSGKNASSMTLPLKKMLE